MNISGIFILHVIGFLTAAVYVLGGIIDNATKINHECASESGLATGDSSILYTIEDSNVDPKFRCFYACIFKKSGAIVNDKLNLEVFMAGWGSLDVEAKHTVTDCYNQGVRANDTCEGSNVIIKCIKKAMKKD